MVDEVAISRPSFCLRHLRSHDIEMEHVEKLEYLVVVPLGDLSLWKLLVDNTVDNSCLEMSLSLVPSLFEDCVPESVEYPE